MALSAIFQLYRGGKF